MNVSQKIKNNPYLKAVNCTDLNDINHGIDECKKLIEIHGNTTKLCVILSKLMTKKEKLTNHKKNKSLKINKS